MEVHLYESGSGSEGGNAVSLREGNGAALAEVACRGPVTIARELAVVFAGIPAARAARFGIADVFAHDVSEMVGDGVHGGGFTVAP